VREKQGKIVTINCQIITRF